MTEQTTQMVDIFSQPIPKNERSRIPVARINKVPDELDPMKQGFDFVLHGHVYRVIERMSRGRIKIRHLGIVSQG